MADSPLNKDGIEGVLKLIGGIVVSGAGVKYLTPFVQSIWDRIRRKDEHAFQVIDRYEQEGWKRLAAEEMLTDQLRGELQAVREQLYKANTELRVKELQLQGVERESLDLRKEIQELRIENDRLMALRLRFGGPEQHQ